MIIPVFGRINGNIEGLLNTLKQMQTSARHRYLDVYQLGDLGYFESATQLAYAQKKEPFLSDGTFKLLTQHGLYKKYWEEAEEYKKLKCTITFLSGKLDDKQALQKHREYHKMSSVSVHRKNILSYFPSGIKRAHLLDKVHHTLFLGIGEDGTSESFLQKNLTDSMQKGIDVVISYDENMIFPDGSSLEKTIKMIKPRLNITNKTPSSVERAGTYLLSPMPQDPFPYHHSDNFFGCIIADKNTKALTFKTGKEVLESYKEKVI